MPAEVKTVTRMDPPYPPDHPAVKAVMDSLRPYLYDVYSSAEERNHSLTEIARQLVRTGVAEDVMVSVRHYLVEEQVRGVTTEAGRNFFQYPAFLRFDVGDLFAFYWELLRQGTPTVEVIPPGKGGQMQSAGKGMADKAEDFLGQMALKSVKNVGKGAGLTLLGLAEGIFTLAGTAVVYLVKKMFASEEEKGRK